MGGDKKELRTPSASPSKKSKSKTGDLVSEISTIEIKKTTKVSSTPLSKNKSSVHLKPHPIINKDQDQNEGSRKMDPKQPQIHPSPLQPQMSQMSQPIPGYPPQFRSQALLQDPSQAALYNSQGQYSITVNTNDPNAFTTMMMPSVVSRNPVQMRCPYCNENICTIIKYENNALVWILTILLFIFCCCCFCIPLLIDDIKDVIHYCPNCNREIARIDR
ncbi:hypothetical protein H8356DRAFT_1009929 [Neocallimastix lanati (nom. inval.)]|jgi:hypothetical protein|nr:hypothetical protein H8356DRAFT_1009929 [Neocallimastix sp. JGI-2020a]